MSKGPDAFRTISEVAGELSLPQHVLRFWETRFTHIKPLKRGGGRRYYRPDDVELLRGIRHLLYGEGYTIRGVQRILKEQGTRFVMAAGRGAAAGAGQRAASVPEEADDSDLEALLNGSHEDSDEQAFESRDSRPVPPPAPSNGSGKPVRAPTPPLSGDEKERLQTTLSELLELKRLLDQSR